MGIVYNSFNAFVGLEIFTIKYWEKIGAKRYNLIVVS